jgi:hypothetical protein
VEPLGSVVASFVPWETPVGDLFSEYMGFATSLPLDDGLDEKGGIPDDDVEEEHLSVSQHSSCSVLYVNLWKIYPPPVGHFGAIMGWIRRLFARVFCCFCRIFASKSSTVDREDQLQAYLPKRAIHGLTTSGKQS